MLSLLMSALMTSMAAAAPATTALIANPKGADVVVGDALAGTGAVALQAPEVTARFMETAHGLDINCDPALDECLLQLAAVCTVQQAAFAVVDDDGATHERRLTLRLAVVDGGAVRSVSTLLHARADVSAAEIREAAVELVAPERAASLVVDAEAGSVIALDGLERAVAPMTAPLAGVAPGQHFVDVRFPDGSRSTKSVLLNAGRRTRIVALARPLGADALVWGGWTLVGGAAAAAAIATYSAGVYLYSRGQLEDFSTHYASDRDYNVKKDRADAILAQDHLTDLPTYGYPLFAGAAASAAAGGALLAVGMRWSDLFDPPAEESAR